MALSVSEFGGLYVQCPYTCINKYVKNDIFAGRWGGGRVKALADFPKRMKGFFYVLQDMYD